MTDHQKAARAILARMCEKDPELREDIELLKCLKSPLYTMLLEELGGLSQDIEAAALAETLALCPVVAEA